MANPQTENGHVKIANELFEAMIRAGFNGGEWAVFSVIIRKTYGFNKKTDLISRSQFQKYTGYSLRTITDSLGLLEQKNAIVRINHGTLVAEYGINKDFDSWTLGNVSAYGRKPLEQFSSKTRAVLRKPLGQKTATTKDIITKDIIQKTGTVKINRGFQSMREIFNETKKTKLS